MEEKKIVNIADIKAVDDQAIKHGGYIKGQDPGVKDARRLGQKYSKDVMICIFIERNKETNEFDDRTRIGLASWGSNPGTTELGNYLANVLMQISRGEVFKVVQTMNKGKVIIPNEQEQKEAINIHSLQDKLKKGKV